MLRTLVLATALIAAAAAAQTPTSVERAKSDLDSCLRANVSLELARASGAAAAAAEALGKCDTETGKLDRAIARDAREAGKTANATKAEAETTRKTVVDSVEAFISRNIAE